jgi:predicted alpha/beta-hydrolase family hydrolase
MERFAKDSDPSVRGFLHRPEISRGDALVLTHGAGSNCEAPILVALAAALAEVGFTVLRCDLPYRQERPHGPPRPGGSARDREGLQRAVEALTGLGRFKRVFLGGHSYGGRQASMLAAADPDLAPGLLLLSYPLHPPRKPDQLRTAHFPALCRRALFVHGTCDPFGTLEELRSALRLIPATTSLLPIEGAGHDLGFGRGSGIHKSKPQGWWGALVVEAFRALVGE